MNIFGQMLYCFCNTFGGIFLVDCQVCHRVFFRIGSGRDVFNHCPGDHNNWGFGRRPTKKNEKRTFTCPVCGKQFTDSAGTRNSEANAAYAAFRCCPRPENEGLRNLSPIAREYRSADRNTTMLGYNLVFNSKGVPYATKYDADRSDKVHIPVTPSTRGQPCPECHGTGRYNGVCCDRCGGTGKLLV